MDDFLLKTNCKYNLSRRTHKPHNKLGSIHDRVNIIVSVEIQSCSKARRLV